MYALERVTDSGLLESHNTSSLEMISGYTVHVRAIAGSYYLEENCIGARQRSGSLTFCTDA